MVEKKAGIRFTQDDYITLDMDAMTLTEVKDGESTEYSIGRGVEKKLLYTNPDTTIEMTGADMFAESDLEGYDYIKIEVKEIEEELTKYLFEELSKLDYITIYGPKDLSKKTGVISFNINGIHPHDVASVLDSVGVCVRSGNHCAQPLLRSMDIDSTVRASLYMYNTKEDIDKVTEM